MPRICSSFYFHWKPLLSASGGLLLMLCAGLFLSGCERSYEVKVDGIKDNRYSFPVGTPYALLLPPQGMVGQDFDRAKAEAMVKTALSVQGYYPVDRLEEAELVVTVEFGLSTGRVSFREKPTINTPLIGPGELGYRNYPGIIPVSETEIVPEMVQTKYITFSARDPQTMDDNGKPAEVWNLVVKVEDEGETLEKYMPVLLAASMKYLGTNTGKQIEIDITDDSEAVQYVINDATFEEGPY